MIKDLHRKGVTISDIARITGHERKTIRAILEGPVSPPPQKRKAKTKAKELDSLVPHLEKRIQEGVLNCHNSVPYRAITHVSVESPGAFDRDADLKIWVAGTAAPIEKDLSSGIDIKLLLRTMAEHIVRSGDDRRRAESDPAIPWSHCEHTDLGVRRRQPRRAAAVRPAKPTVEWIAHSFRATTGKETRT